MTETMPQEIYTLLPTIWPVSEAFLRALPDVLRPSAAEVKDIQYPWQFLALMQGRLKANIKESHIPPDTLLNPALTSIDETLGPVWIEKGAIIHPLTELVGPLYIGKGTRVVANSRLRDSIIGANNLINPGTEIGRSITGNGCAFHYAALVDSLLGNNVHFGGGAKALNLRSDKGPVTSYIGDAKVNTGVMKLGAMIGDGVEIAGGAQLMPGVKIGNGSFVGPGVILYKDLPNKTSCRVIQAQERRQL